MDLRKLIVTMTMLTLWSGAACPQGQVATPRPPKRIITKTRLVAVFSELENGLLEALENKRQEALDTLLAEDFQLWTPTPPGDPVPREDWQTQAFAENLKAFSIQQMAARSVDDNAIVVSFVLNKTVERGGKSSNSGYFVVDLWRKAEDKWKLSDRYASPLAGAPRRPSAVKPTGKD